MMRRERNPNLEILERVVHQLGPLVHKTVFLGGCATGLLLTDVAAPPIRATRDVDVITEVASIQDYHRLAAQLRARGFKEDQSPDARMCRWAGPGVLLDVMPTNPGVLGFGNPWYKPAWDNASTVTLPSWACECMANCPHALRGGAYGCQVGKRDGSHRSDGIASHWKRSMEAICKGSSAGTGLMSPLDRSKIKPEFGFELRL
jgi:hypothetical protein